MTVLRQVEIKGISDNIARVSDVNALVTTLTAERSSAFGEPLSIEPTPIFQHNFAYGIPSLEIKQRENNAGTITASEEMIVLASGASANSFSLFETRTEVHYQAGQGARVRFTCLFDVAVINSTQYAGVGDVCNGFFFGYSGTDFGILHRRYGLSEIRTLTISTGSSTSEDITVTLDGVAVTDVSVTNTGDATLTANEISAHDYSDIGEGWEAKVVGNKVIFMAWQTGSKSGTYSLSSATTAIGTFAQDIVGALPTETFISQTSWNGSDKFDGSGPTGITLNPVKGNVFQITYQYLGFGAIEFFIEDTNDGEFHLIHTIGYANNNIRPSLGNPHLPISMEVKNTTNTSSLTMKSGSVSGFIDGPRGNLGLRSAVDAAVTLGATSVETPFLTLRVKELFNGKRNRGSIRLLRVAASVDHTKSVEVAFYENVILTGASYTDIDAGVSILEQDVSATAFTGGRFLFSIPLGRTGQANIDVSDDIYESVFQASEFITVTIKPKSGNAAEATVVLQILETI